MKAVDYKSKYYAKYPWLAAAMDEPKDPAAGLKRKQ